MQIKNFNEVTKELQTYLVSYLEEKGIDTKKKFSCLSPKHEDSNPSCSIIPGGIRAFCYGCSQAFDIFDAVRILEKKAAHGPTFVTDVLQYLAEKYNVVLELGEVSEEKIYELSTYRAYKVAADYILSQPLNKIAEKEVKRRKWSHETLTSTGTGCVPSYEAFIEHLHFNGYTDDEFLRDSDLTRSDIFNKDNLIFTVSDEYGHPVGFAARNLLFKKDDPTTGSKFINQRTTGIKCNIYQKGKRLYGFNLAKEEPGTIYLFEGQGDVLTAREAGLLNCCAIGSTALTTDHILLLKEFNKLNITLATDGDEAGQNAIEKLLDTRFAGHKDMRVSIIRIPGGLDPDDFIRENGIEEFRNLAKWSAFEWRLERFTDKSDPAEISKAMIPFIINEPSYLAQEDMCKILARITGYSLKAIASEVERLQNAHEERKASERRVVVERALKDVLDNPDDAETTLTSARDKLFEIAKKYDEDYMSEEACLKEITTQRLFEENKSDKFSGFILGPDLQNFQEAISGEWDKDVLMVIGGTANSGKTSMCTKLSYEIASHIENDAMVIYHTIDDTAEQLLPKYVAIAEGSRTLSINQIKDPNYWSKQADGYNVLHKRKLGYDLVEGLVKNGRLIIKDANHGTTLAYVETLIAYYQEKYPQRRLVYFLDNFHKLSDFANNNEERVRFKNLSKAIKGLATRYHVPIICTMEYTKLNQGTRPSNNSISESVAMQYDSNFIAHMYNELHDLGPQATSYHIVVKDNQAVRMPRIEMIVGKNKISSFKNSLYFDFYPSSSDFIAIDEDVIANELALAKEEKEASNKKKGFSNPKEGGLYS